MPFGIPDNDDSHYVTNISEGVIKPTQLINYKELLRRYIKHIETFHDYEENFIDAKLVYPPYTELSEEDKKELKKLAE